jgi:GntR family transcriptional regulator/MocR family aminotransferase
MRGVFCSPEQIIPTTGLETALDLTIRVMIDPGHSVHIEDPTIDSVRAAFSAAGAQLYPLQTDAGPHAMDTSRRPPPRLIFVSPSTSFPLGQQMPESQRLSILDQAAAANAVIFECDACGELSYTGQRLQAIQGHDPRGQVLYFGSLTEALGPHIRMGFLVVPTSLIEAFSAMGHRISFSPDQFILTAIARLIEENRYAMHLRSIRSAYSQRMRLVVQACHALMNNVTVVEPMGGLHIALKFDDTLNEAAICSAATMQGLAVAPLSRFYMHPTRESGLVLGFGALPNRTIEHAVRRLAGIIEQSISGAPTLRAG